MTQYSASIFRDVNKATEYKAKAKASVFKAKENVLLLLLHSAY